MEILRVDNLSFTYALGTTPALSGVSLSIEEGDFFLLCGASGSGKSTLLRFLKPELRPHGTMQGEVFCAEQDIGFVMQNPEAQMVTDKVWHELAFGLENRGVPTGEIRRRVAEIAYFFGIQHLFREKTASLSGGQKQLVNLAAVMVMNPRILILDEPTAQLDPVVSHSFLEALARVNRELGVTVILAEHALEEPFALCRTGALMENGAVVYQGSPADLARDIAQNRPAMRVALPAAAQMAADCHPPVLPLSVGEGRRWFRDYLAQADKEKNTLSMPVAPACTATASPMLEAKDIWFGYQKGAEPILRGLSLTVRKGDFFALLGGNGSGKTTLLRLFSGGLSAQNGQVRVQGQPIGTHKRQGAPPAGLSVLPQNPQSLFLHETLYQDLADALPQLTAMQRAPVIESMARQTDIAHLLQRHPYDLSGGEMQRAALAKILLCQPTILLLDEPTKGLDAPAKHKLGQLLENLRAEGMTILLMSHDVEFCAVFARRCALLFDGIVVSEDEPHAFFGGNRYYTTAAQRITAGMVEGIITSEEGAALCRQIRRAD